MKYFQRSTRNRIHRCWFRLHLPYRRGPGSSLADCSHDSLQKFCSRKSSQFFFGFPQPQLFRNRLLNTFHQLRGQIVHHSRFDHLILGSISAPWHNRFIFFDFSISHNSSQRTDSSSCPRHRSIATLFTLNVTRAKHRSNFDNPNCCSFCVHYCFALHNFEPPLFRKRNGQRKRSIWTLGALCAPRAKNKKSSRDSGGNVALTCVCPHRQTVRTRMKGEPVV